VVAKVRERLAMSKQTTHRFHMERFNLKKLKEVEDKGHCIEISNKFTALENLGAEMDINRAWETVRKNIEISVEKSLGYYEFEKHKPWFDKGGKVVP
jgi:hypothetical protein